MGEFNLTPLRFYCQKVLPLVYEDALSYYETLCKVVSKLNEVIQQYNDFNADINTNITDLVNSLIDEKIKELDDELSQSITALDQKYEAVTGSIQTNLSDLNDKTDNNYTTLQSVIKSNQTALTSLIISKTDELNLQLHELSVLVANNDVNQKHYTDAAIESLRNWILTQSTIYVTDPTTGLNSTIQTVVNNLYNTFRYYALSAGEFDSLLITCKQYDDLYLTAIEYDYHGKFYLGNRLFPWMIFSDLTGNYITTIHAIHELWAYIRTNATTAQAYDDKDFTAISYDNLELTAYNFSFNSLP